MGIDFGINKGVDHGRVMSPKTFSLLYIELGFIFSW